MSATRFEFELPTTQRTVLEPRKPAAAASTGVHHFAESGASQTTARDMNPRKGTKLRTFLKVFLIVSNSLFVLMCVGIIVFCIIRFVLPIAFEKSSENFMIFMIPSSLTQASISAAGLMAVSSQLSWPLICYSLVLIMPLIGSISWLYVRFADIYTLEAPVLKMFFLLILCCATWCGQIFAAVLLYLKIRAKNRIKVSNLRTGTAGSRFEDSSYLFVDD